MSIDNYSETDDSSIESRRETDGLTVAPKWWMGGHTLIHICLSIITMGLWLFVWVPLLAIKFTKRGKVRYTLDGDRLRLIDDGSVISSSSTQQIPVRDITDIQTSASVVEGWFNVGTVEFRERDGTGSSVSLDGIPRHEQFAREIGKLQDQTAKETRYR
jgi:hypothetical protein